MKRAGVVLLVLLLILVVGDLALRSVAENAAARSIEDQVSGNVAPDVAFGGFPFLLSLARGSFEKVTIDVSSATEGSLRMEDIHLTLRDVEVDPFEVARGDGTLRARLLRGRGEISESALNEIVAEEAPVEVDVQDGRVLVSRDGVSVPANVVVAGNRLLVGAGDAISPLEIPLPSLNPEINFNSVTAEDGRLVVGVAASRLRLST